MVQKVMLGFKLNFRKQHLSQLRIFLDQKICYLGQGNVLSTNTIHHVF